MNPLSNDLFVVTYYDLKRVYFRHRTLIKTVVWLSGALVLLLLLLKEPKFRSEATFKQTSKQNEMSLNMKEIFQQFVSLPTENATLAVMSSKEILRSALEEQGMQAACQIDPFYMKMLKRIYRNLACEFMVPIENTDQFSFEKVSYSGEEIQELYLKWKGGEKIELADANKRVIAEANIGQPIVLKDLRLTVKHIPKNIRENQLYSLKIYPWFDIVEKIKKNLKITASKLDKTILELTFNDKDRIVAASFLNHVMQSYQSYFKRENDAICKTQIEYLEKRREELTSYFDRALIEHVDYLKDNLNVNGFMGFAQEVATLSEPKNLYTSELFAVDLELERLRAFSERSLFDLEANKTNSKKEKLAQHHSKAKIRPIEDVNSPLVKEKKDLVGKWDTYTIEKERMEAVANPLSQEITDLNSQEQEAKVLLHSLEKGEAIPKLPFLSKDPKSAIALLVKQISNSCVATGKEKVAPSLEKGQAVAHLQNLISQLQRKRQLLQEDLYLQKEDLSEFTGLTIDKSKQLLGEYLQQRDRLQAELKELVFLRDQISNYDFEVSSLGAVFSDGVTNELVQKASAIALQLKDDNNRSIREQERLQETLQSQKDFLSQYLFQTIELKKIRNKLCEDKIVSLNKTTLRLLNSEKELLSNKLLDLNTKMAELPEKWRRESILMLKKELGSLMLEGISQLAESKHLSQQIFQVNSKPLDRAIPPVKQKSPFILLSSALAAIIGGCLCYFGVLCKTLMKGMPVSEDNLKVSGFPVSGRFTQKCGAHFSKIAEKDMETLRHLAEFLSAKPNTDGAIAAVCIGGKYPDYSLSLAELLSMRGKKVLAIQHIFNREPRPDEIPGLFQYMNGQTDKLPIRHQLSFDILPCGGEGRLAGELVNNSRFASIISRVKLNYDIILLYSSAEAAKAEGFALLKVADTAIITIQQEIKDELLVYCDWAQRKGSDCAKFVYIDEMA